MQPAMLTRIAALLLALMLTNCAQNPVSGNPNLVLLSESQEITIGWREDTNVRKQYSAYDDARLQQYVSEIGQRLAKTSHRPGIDYSFLVMDSPDVNAFARPLRLRVITAQANTTFAELAKRSPLGRFAEGHLRVINGLYPAGEPVAGQPLKIVE